MDPHFLNLSLINSFRTGNVILDLIVAAMVPAVCVGLWERFGYYWRRLVSFLIHQREQRGSVYLRHISHTKTTPFDDEVDECANHVLQNAIRTYIGTQLPTTYIRGTVRMSEIKSVNGGGRSRNRWDSDDDDDDGSSASADKKNLFESGGLKVLSLPNTSTGPVEIAPGLLFTERFSVDDDPDEDEKRRKGQGGATKTSELTYTLTSAGHGGRNGKEIVDDFLKTVMKWYEEEVRKQEDDSRWMYQPLVANGGSADRLYKRYKLSSEKSFKSLFFNDKARIVKVLDAFANKTGKYKIKGFPHRLSILLHGPPGTGKTSLVKAIALYTNRHVVSVPLSRMKTNQEFMDVMMDCVFKYCVAGKRGGGGNDDDDEAGNDGGTKRIKLAFENIVFLLEDVDAASTVVHRKSQQPTQQASNAASSQGGSKQRVVSPSSKTPAGDFPAASPLSSSSQPSSGENANEGKDNDDDDEGAGLMVRDGTTAFHHHHQQQTAATSTDKPDGESADTNANNKDDTGAPPSNRSTPPPEGDAASGGLVRTSSSRSNGNNASNKKKRAGGKKEGGDDSASSASSSEAEEEAAAGDERGAERRRRRRKAEETTDQLAKMCQMLIQQQGANSKKGTLGLADLLAQGESDALSLESILTVLDGVIDTPGRILVMTTNHPERLDPALIRNGRINLKLYMGHLTSTQVEHMTAHYYPNSDPNGLRAVVEAFKRLGDVPAHPPSPSSSSSQQTQQQQQQTEGSGDIATTRISPAEFEQMCAECTTVWDLAARLTQMSDAITPARSPPTPSLVAAE